MPQRPPTEEEKALLYHWTRAMALEMLDDVVEFNTGARGRTMTDPAYKRGFIHGLLASAKAAAEAATHVVKTPLAGQPPGLGPKSQP
jgi:hypothetical protein